MGNIATNKKAHYQYEILEKYEAGIVLKGTEVKSLRNKNVSLNESYAQLKNEEIFLYNLDISPYEQGNRENHEPKRVRKLLLHRREIRKLIGKVQQKGFTLIPTSLYFKNGLAKIQIAVGRGKQLHDKRDTIKKRMVDREIKRALKQ